MKFVAPESYVISVRVNRAESRILTDAARIRGVKVSTFIREAALDAARLSNKEPAEETE